MHQDTKHNVLLFSALFFSIILQHLIAGFRYVTWASLLIKLRRTQSYSPWWKKHPREIPRTALLEGEYDDI